MTAPIAHPLTTAHPPQDEVKTAAKQLEAFFLRTLMSEARGAGGGDGTFDGGFAGDTFREMLDGAMSDKMSAAGGVGLAGVIEKAMRRDDPQGHDSAAIGALGGAHAPMALTQAAPHQIDESYASLPSANGATFLKPASGRYTSGFGGRVDPIDHTASVHPGLDIAANQGAPVHAAAEGVVTHAGPAGTYGNLVTIKHPSGLETRYAHLSHVLVREGDRVPVGAEVGKVGATGRVTGPHLHFEVRDHGKAVDPRPYLETPALATPATDGNRIAPSKTTTPP